jgi:purine-binding chemotaxis protein CheW
MERDHTDEKQQEKTFDWEGVRQRIAATKAALEKVSETPQDVLERIWAQRAEQFAQVPVEEEVGSRVELVQVRLGREMYGLDAGYVFGIRPAEQITPVPRVPDWVAGVVNLSGRILSVVDLGKFFGLPPSEPDEANDDLQTGYLLVVETPDMEVALLADEVLDVQDVPVSRIRDTADTVRGISPEYVVGVTERKIEDEAAGEGELMVVLDLPSLLADDQLAIHEEVV